MRRRRQLSHDLDRLNAATLFFMRQQSERIMLGDDREREDVERETHEVVADVVNRLEQSLDEDLVERLERGEFFHPFAPWKAWWNMFGFGVPRTLDGPRFRSKAVLGRREDTMLDEILADFRANVQSTLRRARRDDRSLTEAEIDELLSDLREDMKLIARRSRRREERREREEDERCETVE